MMLYLADKFFTVLHLGIIFFNLFGWISVRTRLAHRWCAGVTTAFWLLIGPLMGYQIGYCPIVDIQWRIKSAMGETGLPNSYISYLLRQVGIIADDRVVDIFTGSIFAAALAMTLWLWWREKRGMAKVVTA
jgi:hypothetical protein